MLNNTYLINHEGRLVLIDAPSDIVKVVDFLKVNNLTLDEVWLTHIHFDHTLGLIELKSIFPNLKVYLSDEEAKLINDPKSNLTKDFGITSFKYEGELYDSSNLESKNLKVKYISGHSLKSCVYIFIKEKEMFTGDVLFNNSIGRSDLVYGDEEKLISGIKDELFSFEGYKVYPGHGFSTSIEEERRGKFFND